MAPILTRQSMQATTRKLPTSRIPIPVPTLPPTTRRRKVATVPKTKQSAFYQRAVGLAPANTTNKPQKNTHPQKNMDPQENTKPQENTNSQAVTKVEKSEDISQPQEIMPPPKVSQPETPPPRQSNNLPSYQPEGISPPRSLLKTPSTHTSPKEIPPPETPTRQPITLSSYWPEGITPPRSLLESPTSEATKQNTIPSKQPNPDQSTPDLSLQKLSLQQLSPPMTPPQQILKPGQPPLHDRFAQARETARARELTRAQRLTRIMMEAFERELDRKTYDTPSNTLEDYSEDRLTGEVGCNYEAVEMMEGHYGVCVECGMEGECVFVEGYGGDGYGGDGYGGDGYGGDGYQEDENECVDCGVCVECGCPLSGDEGSEEWFCDAEECCDELHTEIEEIMQDGDGEEENKVEELEDLEKMKDISEVEKILKVEEVPKIEEINNATENTGMEKEVQCAKKADQGKNLEEGKQIKETENIAEAKMIRKSEKANEVEKAEETVQKPVIMVEAVSDNNQQNRAIIMSLSTNIGNISHNTALEKYQPAKSTENIFPHEPRRQSVYSQSSRPENEKKVSEYLQPIEKPNIAPILLHETGQPFLVRKAQEIEYVSEDGHMIRRTMVEEFFQYSRSSDLLIEELPKNGLQEEKWLIKAANEQIREDNVISSATETVEEIRENVPNVSIPEHEQSIKIPVIEDNNTCYIPGDNVAINGTRSSREPPKVEKKPWWE